MVIDRVAVHTEANGRNAPEEAEFLGNVAAYFLGRC
jgi:hypothetical protein